VLLCVVYIYSSIFLANDTWQGAFCIKMIPINGNSLRLRFEFDFSCDNFANHSEGNSAWLVYNMSLKY